ncbi:MAG: GNAT family N-acetyltransferase [Chitinophagales bacterium]
MTILETERLLIEEVNINDTAFIFKLLNSPGWLKFIGNRGINNLADAEAYIQNPLMKSYEENGLGLYKVVRKKNAEPMGLCGLISRPILPNVDIGFAILPEYEGKSYTFEAAKAIIDDGTARLGLKVVLGITSPDNVKSQKLLEKLGLKFVERLQLNGYEDDTFLYSNEENS